MSERVGFIGLGNMGHGLSSNLCRKGFSLTVYDVNPAPDADLRQLGARTATNAGEVAAASDIVGTTLSGRYLVTRKVGQGGMGAVYEATHTLIGKRVAVKVLLEKYAKREAIVVTFLELSKESYASGGVLMADKQ